MSTRATEIPVRIEIRLATSARPIQIQAMNQTLLSIMTPSFCRSHQLKCGSSSAKERQTPLPDANASWGFGAAQAFGAGGLDQVQQRLSISIDGASRRAEISPVLCFA